MKDLFSEHSLPAKEQIYLKVVMFLYNLVI